MKPARKSGLRSPIAVRTRTSPGSDPYLALIRAQWAERPERLDAKFPILGFLMESAMSGYGLRRTFESALGFSYRVSDGSLYPALKTLLGEGLLTMRPRRQGMRTSKVYAITPAGRAWFLHRLGEPSPPMAVVDEAQTKLYFARYRPAVALEHLERMRRFNHDWAAMLQRVMKDPSEDASDPFRAALLEIGWRLTRYNARVLGAIARKLARELDAQRPGVPGPRARAGGG